MICSRVTKRLDAPCWLFAVTYQDPPWGFLSSFAESSTRRRELLWQAAQAPHGPEAPV